MTGRGGGEGGWEVGGGVSQYNSWVDIWADSQTDRLILFFFTILGFATATENHTSTKYIHVHASSN